MGTGNDAGHHSSALYGLRGGRPHQTGLMEVKLVRFTIYPLFKAPELTSTCTDTLEGVNQANMAHMGLHTETVCSQHDLIMSDVC